jgi:hypothetical protein
MTPAAEVVARREYDAPDLVIYGDIADLTHGPSSHSSKKKKKKSKKSKKGHGGKKGGKSPRS